MARFTAVSPGGQHGAMKQFRHRFLAVDPSLGSDVLHRVRLTAELGLQWQDRQPEQALTVPHAWWLGNHLSHRIACKASRTQVHCIASTAYFELGETSLVCRAVKELVQVAATASVPVAASSPHLQYLRSSTSPSRGPNPFLNQNPYHQLLSPGLLLNRG